jgi:hypothetical protein
MKVSPRGAPAAGRERLLKLPFYEVAGTVKFAAETRLYCRVLLPNAKRILKAGSVRHTSTNFFVVWKTSARFFARSFIQNPNAADCQVSQW